MHIETRGFHVSHAGPTNDKTQSLIVIECTGCHYWGFSYMAYAEVDALLNGGSIIRRCMTCGTKTAWKEVNTHGGVHERASSHQH